MGPNRKYATGSGMKGSVPDHDTTVRVPKFDQGTYRPPPGQEVVSALDRMQEAKLNPGQCSTPFVAGDNVTSLPTGVCTVANAVAECVSLNSLGELGGMYPIGGDVYTFIIQCNSMTAYHGPGGQSAAGIPYHQPDTKLGGMVIVQLAQAQMDLGFLRKDIFAQLQGGLTMAEVFRSDMEGFSDGGVVWAQETDIMEIIPEAMRACPRWKSTLIFG